MTHYTILSSNLKRGILHFSESITKRLSRSQFKLVSQMIYGMLSAQSCHLSNIARSLDEKTSLKKTIDRLSPNLSAFQDRATLLSDMVRKVKGCLSDKTVLLFDGSDITKPCSPKMEYIGRVFDAIDGHSRLFSKILPIKRGCRLRYSKISKNHFATAPSCANQGGEPKDGSLPLITFPSVSPSFRVYTKFGI